LYFSSASLQQAEERAEALEAKLKLNEEALEKAQADAASVEEVRQRLHKAYTSLSDNITEQIAREKGIVDRIEAQSRRFFRKLLLLLESSPCFILLADHDHVFCYSREEREEVSAAGTKK
jgi:phage terminase Nu1 subunit (DNA packaging protein)